MSFQNLELKEYPNQNSRSNSKDCSISTKYLFAEKKSTTLKKRYEKCVLLNISYIDQIIIINDNFVKIKM